MSQEPIFEVGEIAPHSQQAEEALLGSILINPMTYHEVIPFLTGEDFFILRNGWIFEAMMRLDARGDRIEFLTVVEELKNQRRLDDIGGSAYVTYLSSNAATSVHAEAYGRIVQRTAIRRRMLEAAGEITQLAREEDADINDVIERAEETLAYATSGHREAQVISLDAHLSEAWDRTEDTDQNREAGIELFLPDLQYRFGEMPRGWFIIVAGKEGTGKSRFSLQWTLYLLMHGRTVWFFSAEVDVSEIIWTLLSMMSSLDGGLYLSFTDMQMRRIHDDPKKSERYTWLMNEFSKFHFQPIDAQEMTARQVYDIGKLADTDMIVVDYLQELDPMIGKWNNDFSEMGERVRLLRKMAKKSGALVLCVSQFNRDGNKAKQPGTEHFAESDKIGKMAQVAFSIVDEKGVLIIRCIKDRYLGIKHKFVKTTMHETYGTYQQLMPEKEVPPQFRTLENF